MSFTQAVYASTQTALHEVKISCCVPQPPFVASILTFALPSVKRFLLGASLLKYSLNFCLSDLQNTICRALFSTLNVFLYSHFYRNNHLPHEPLILRSSPTEDSLLGVSDCVVLWQVAYFYDTMSDHRFEMNTVLIFPSNQISYNTRHIITQKRCIHFVQTTCFF